MYQSRAVLCLLLLGVATHQLTEGRSFNIIDGCFIDCYSGQQYWPHPSNCEKFIQCSPYVAKEMPCAEGFRWDQSILTCGHKDSTACVTGNYVDGSGNPCAIGNSDVGNSDGVNGDFGDSGSGDSVDSGTVDDSDGGNESGDNINVGNINWPSASVDGCIIECSSGKHYWSHPTSCQMFVQCTPYGPQEMPCPAGTRWNQNILTCDHEDSTSCVTGNYVDESGNSCGGGNGDGINDDVGNGESGDGGDDDDNDGGNGAGDSGNVGNINWPSGSVDGCIIDCSLGQHYWSHPTSCKRFVQCAPYGPQEMPCPAGTRWNQAILTCDHESSTACVTGNYVDETGISCGGGKGDGVNGDSGTDEGEIGDGGDGESGSSDGGDGDSGGSEGGDGDSGSSDGGDGDGGNIEGGDGGSSDGGNEAEDDKNWLSGTVNGCIIDCASGQEYLQHPSQCPMFVQCTLNGPQEMHCAPGTLWNQTMLTCTDAQKTRCEFGSYVDENGDQCPPPRCNGHACGPPK